MPGKNAAMAVRVKLLLSAKVSNWTAVELTVVRSALGVPLPERIDINLGKPIVPKFIQSLRRI